MLDWSAGESSKDYDYDDDGDDYMMPITAIGNSNYTYKLSVCLYRYAYIVTEKNTVLVYSMNVWLIIFQSDNSNIHEISKTVLFLLYQAI